MSVDSKSMRYGHCEGHTHLCYDDSGSHILTCGADGDVRIWTGIEDEDPISHRAGDKVFSVAYKNGRFFTAADDNVIKAHTFKEGEPDGILTRFTAPVTDMCFSQDGSILVAGASDFCVQVVDVKTSVHRSFQGHEAPILSVALDPQQLFVATASCDGTVKVWGIEDQTVAKSWDVIPKSNDFSASQTLCRLCWNKTGEHLLVPVEKEVQVYSRDAWTHAYSLTDPSIDEIITVLALSPCGRFLAAACVNGTMVVWNMDTKQCITRDKHDKGFTICAMAWNPRGNNELSICDNEGNIGTLEGVLTMDQFSLKTAGDAQEGLTAEQYADLFDDDDMMEASKGQGQVTADSDDDDPVLGTQRKKNLPCIDDDNSMDTEFSKAVLDEAKDDMASVMSGRSSPVAAPRPLYMETARPVDLQRPFQPGSTPEHLAQRFMMWNSVGLIRQYNTDEENSIDIEFHDTSVHHAMHVTNTLNHTMADMSDEAVVLACTSDEDVPSQLVCMHFGSWDNCKDWTAPMPEGENIQAVTIGDKWIAVATDRRLVRMFTVGGIQQELFSLPGPVVAMTAHSNQLLIVYHMGTGVPGDQCLAVKLLQVQGRKKVVIGGDSLPLTAKATLAWIGFSAEGTPLSVDSAGIVRMLNRGFGSTWTQVANTKKHCKGKSDNYWIVGVVEDPQQLRCILCKGSRFPPTLPRPAVSILPFELPLCEISTDKGQIEETFWRTRVFNHHFEFWSCQGLTYDERHEKQATMPEQESLMKMFALACKTDREVRAVEICEMMPSQHTVQLAIKYASRLRLMQLAQRIGEIARQKSEEELARLAGDEEEDGVEYGSQHGYHQPASGGASRSSHQGAPPVRKTMRDDGDEEAEVGQSNGTHDVEEEEEEEKKPSGPMLNLKPKKEKEVTMPVSLSQGTAKKNPFKLGLQRQASVPKGTSVFDSMTKTVSNSRNPFGKSTTEKEKSPEAAKSQKKKVSSQPKLFAKSKSTDKTEARMAEDSDKPNSKPKTGFQLWLQENQKSVQEKHPEASESDLTIMAAKMFKQLPKEEQQEWSDKAKGIKSKEANEEDGDSKKRKRDENSQSESLSQTKKLAKDSDKDVVNHKKKPLSQTTNSKLAGFAFNKS